MGPAVQIYDNYLRAKYWSRNKIEFQEFRFWERGTRDMRGVDQDNGFIQQRDSDRVSGSVVQIHADYALNIGGRKNFEK